MDTLGMAADEELPVRAAAHDGAAFGELFERHADAVYNHCFRRCGSWSQAEDLTSGRPWWVDHSSWSFRVAIFLSHLFWVACRRHGPKLWLFDRAWRGETAKDAPGPAHQVRGRPQNVVTLELRSPHLWRFLHEDGPLPPGGPRPETFPGIKNGPFFVSTSPYHRSCQLMCGTDDGEVAWTQVCSCWRWPSSPLPSSCAAAARQARTRPPGSFRPGWTRPRRRCRSCWASSRSAGAWRNRRPAPWGASSGWSPARGPRGEWGRTCWAPRWGSSRPTWSSVTSRSVDGSASSRSPCPTASSCPSTPSGPVWRRRPASRTRRTRWSGRSFAGGWRRSSVPASVRWRGTSTSP